ncbi:AbrB/MazE/SpoVT family DNA-binding domain-containing protein [Patescibacteria group bacterium]|nr:AbrB/MazE/SpoVT family DNA-binding domain-containing protein [Patescibacteria group bacterium]
MPNNIALLKLFGKGQITLPKKWRTKFQTKHFIAEETPQGILIKPLNEVNYYEIDENNFGLNFPTGIEANNLATKLSKANEKLS